MLQVHHLNNSRSQRILWMLEEIAVPYEIVAHQRLPSFAAPESLKAVHPLGKSPVIRDGDLVIAESGAIVEYLAQTYAPHLIPEPGTPEALRHTYWMHYAEGSAMPPLVMKLLLGFMGEAGAPMMGLIDLQIANHMAFMNAELGAGPFFLGDALSACDFLMIFPLEASAARGGLSAYPALQAYVDRIHARPAYQAGLERGGPYGIINPA